MKITENGIEFNHAESQVVVLMLVYGVEFPNPAQAVNLGMSLSESEASGVAAWFNNKATLQGITDNAELFTLEK